MIDNALKAAERGAALTQRMLAFARKQDLKLETFDITQLVRGMAELLQRAIGPHIEIDTRFPLSQFFGTTFSSILCLARIRLCNAPLSISSGNL